MKIPFLKRIFSDPALGIVLVTAFLVRIACIFIFDLPLRNTDSYFYELQAGNLLLGNWGGYFPEGYPILILILDKLTGALPVDLVAVLFNQVLAVLTAWFVYKVSIHIYKQKTVALLSCLIILFYPNQLNFGYLMVSEAASAFLIVFGYWLWRIKENAPLAGFVMGFGFVVRPTLLPMVLLYMLISSIEKKHTASQWIAAGLFFFGFTFSYLSYRSGGGFEIADNEISNIVIASESFGENINFSAHIQHPEIAKRSDAFIYYFNNMKSDPGHYLLQRIASLNNLWGPIPDAGGYNGDARRSPLKRGLISLRFFLLLGALTGFYFSKQRKEILILLIPAIVITVLHTMLFSNNRFTFPAEPFLVIPFTYALAELYGWLSAKRAPHPV